MCNAILLRQTKWGHLKDVHKAIEIFEVALLVSTDPVVISLGPKSKLGGTETILVSQMFFICYKMADCYVDRWTSQQIYHSTLINVLALINFF